MEKDFLNQATLYKEKTREPFPNIPNVRSSRSITVQKLLLLSDCTNSLCYLTFIDIWETRSYAHFLLRFETLPKENLLSAPSAVELCSNICHESSTVKSLVSRFIVYCKSYFSNIPRLLLQYITTYCTP